MRYRQTLMKNLKRSLILMVAVVFALITNIEAEGNSLPDLEGRWKGWGGVELVRDTEMSYTGTYEDTYGTDVGRILLELFREEEGEYFGEWWEGEARVGKLKFHISDDGRSIRGTWCALDSSRIKPGKPSCDKPSSFHWYR